MHINLHFHFVTPRFNGIKNTEFAVKLMLYVSFYIKGLKDALLTMLHIQKE